MWTWRCKRCGTSRSDTAPNCASRCYNVFNHVNFAQFSDGSADPTVGQGGATPFGFSTTGQQLSGVSSNRQFQFGLKLAF